MKGKAERNVNLLVAGGGATATLGPSLVCAEVDGGQGGDGAVCARIWEKERCAMVEELGGDVTRRGERKRER